MTGVQTCALPIFIAGVAGWAVNQYARNHYFAVLRDGEVQIMQGRPGGYLGWDPTLERRTGVMVTDLPQSDRAQFSDGIGAEGSLDEVEAYVDRLTELTTTTTASTVPTSTSATVAPTTTTRATPTTRPRRRRGTTATTNQIGRAHV